MAKTVTVFGASSGSGASRATDLYEQALRLGCLLAEAGYTVCNGGYGGTMEASARGARGAGGSAVGITNAVFDPKPANAWIDDERKAPDFFERLRRLITLAVSETRVVVNFQAGRSGYNAYIADNLGRTVVLPVILLVARHEVKNLENAILATEGGFGDVRVGKVALVDLECMINPDLEKTAAFLVENRAEHRWRVKIGQAEPVDGCDRINQCG